MKKLFLHIGPHKTGSTYLQKKFYENRGLLYQNNFLYPEEFISIQWGHHELPKKIVNREQDAIEDFIADIIKSDKNILLSSENFDKLNKEDLIFFKKLLDKYFDVKIVFFKRKLDELLISYWQEKIKHGSTKSWQKFLLDNVLKPFSNNKENIINQKKILDTYSEIFDISNIIIIDYNQLINNNQNIFIFFMKEVLNISFDIQVSNNMINKSLNYIDAEIIRYLNYLYKQENFVGEFTLMSKAFRDYKKANINEYENLLKLYEPYLFEINFNDIFIFKLLENKFNDKYKKNIINYDENKKDKTFNLIKEEALFDNQIHNAVSNLYHRINIK